MQDLRARFTVSSLRLLICCAKTSELDVYERAGAVPITGVADIRNPPLSSATSTHCGYFQAAPRISLPHREIASVRLSSSPSSENRTSLSCARSPSWTVFSYPYLVASSICSEFKPVDSLIVMINLHCDEAKIQCCGCFKPGISMTAREGKELEGRPAGPE